MRSPRYLALRVVCVALGLVLACVRPFGLAVEAQEEATPALWLDLVNQLRLDEGLDPYAQSRLLSQAAQRHADDVAENGFADPEDMHRGSDGTDAEGRILETGYAAWTLEGDQVAAAENVWSGEGTPEDALAGFLGDQTYREHLLSAVYREIGIGIATDEEGRSIYVLDFGARPNVLPIFINDGAASTENREVAIRLTNETARPEGEGATFMGEAVEIRISNETSFDELEWQPWAALVSWVLPDTSGEHTVYIQFRDAAGRTAASADTIVLDLGTPTTPTAVPPTATPTPSPTATPVPPSPTPEPTATLEPTPSEVPSVPPPTATPTVSYATPTSAPLARRVTPFPTWTPLPSPSPTATEADVPGEETLSLPSMRGYGRTLAAVGILQGLVVVLGIFGILRRGKGA